VELVAVFNIGVIDDAVCSWDCTEVVDVTLIGDVFDID